MSGQNPLPVTVYGLGGLLSALGVNAIGAIKPSKGILARILPQNAGSGGVLTLNDVAGSSLTAPSIAYSATVPYTVGQAVLSSGTLYFCTAATQGNAPPNASFWATTPPANSQIISLANSAMTAGVPVTLEWPCQNGILVTAVPTGSPSINFSYS